MTKKILSTIVLAAALFAGFKTYVYQNKMSVSPILLANVEALSREENTSQKTWQVAEVTETVEYYETTSPGWEWSIGAELWKFNGELTHESPLTYEKTTKTIKYSCCREMGNLKDCSYEAC